MRDERGFTLMEVLIAMFVLGVGVVATVGIFNSSKEVSLIAQRHEVAVHQAQKVLEELKAKPYAQLGLTSKPAIGNRLTSDPDTIGYHNDSNTTDGSSFTVVSAGSGAAVTERLALSDSVPGGTVNPAPVAFNVGAVDGSEVSGVVYKYVTWRPERCGTSDAICPGDRNTKRVLVAVTIDAKGRPGLTRPVWISSVVIDPASGPGT
jgi:prepilin-type N-terminal cleavage/methylation domain-containing protein